MSGHLRVVLIDADGESATAAIEAALRAFPPQAVVAPLPAPAALPVSLPAPRKPRAAKAARTSSRKPGTGNAAKARAAPAAASAAAEPEAAPAAPDVGANGVTVAGNVVSFDGRSITVAPREADLARELVKVMPNVADRTRLQRALWGRSDDSPGVMLVQYARKLHASVEAIGLKVTIVRGIGVTLAPA